LTLYTYKKKGHVIAAGKWGDDNGEKSDEGEGEAKDVRDRLKDVYNPTNHTADTQKNGLGREEEEERGWGEIIDIIQEESQKRNKTKRSAERKKRKEGTINHPRPSRRSPRPAPSQNSLSGCLSQTRATQAPQSLGTNNTERRPSDPRARAGADVGVGLVGDRARREVIERLGRAGT
jgi:hypothetical protein